MAAARAPATARAAWMSPPSGPAGSSGPGTVSCQYDSRRYRSVGLVRLMLHYPARSRRPSIGDPVRMPADRRALASPPAPRAALKIYEICLVCLGNICRSPMAQAVLTAELARAGLAGRVLLTSAGTGDWHIGESMDRRARAELARRGYDG